MEFSDRETPEFILPSPISSDLNLMDYSTWSVLEEKVIKHH